jgi:hypothetical protein
MSNSDDQIEVQVDDAEIPAKTGETAPAQAAKREVEPEVGIESLKEQLEKERLIRIEMERRAKEFANSAMQAKNEAQDGDLHLVTNAIESVEQNDEVLKSNYSQAMASGDYDRAAEYQQAMSNNAAKLLQLEQGKQALESMPKQKAPEPVGVSDPVETLASQLTPRSAAWIRKNPQFASDPRQYQRMLAAHQSGGD